MQSAHSPSLGNPHIYDRVTAHIIEAIEAGIKDGYEMPWHAGTAMGFPRNAATKRPYHGVNTLVLWSVRELRKYASPYWATYKQWKSLGAQVRGGEKAAPIVFYQPKEETSEGAEEQDERPRAVVRSSYVFNAAQVDGWEEPIPFESDRTQRLEAVERFVRTVGAKVTYGGTAAYYQHVADRIFMPERNSFVGTKTMNPTESFYAVLLHEHVHWTGHPSRLDRDLSGRFGTQAYAMEELVAELGAAFLCAELGISNEPRRDHAVYVRSWLSVLRETHSAIVTAASVATKACGYLQELSSSKQAA